MVESARCSPLTTAGTPFGPRYPAAETVPTEDPATVKLAGAPVATQGRGIPMTSVADLNRDGRLDLLLHFRTQDLQLTPTSKEAVLKGTTLSGQGVRGADSIRIVP